MDRVDVLKEAADHLSELNIRAALDSLKKTFKEPIDAFKKGYRKGRGLPDDEPKAEPEVYGPKHEPENDEPKDDPVDVKKAPKKKKAPVEKKPRELKSAAGCAPAPKAKDKIRCPKPGGGHVYYSKEEFKRLRAQIKQKSGGRKKK